jgi:hypothetical protein
VQLSLSGGFDKGCFLASEVAARCQALQNPIQFDFNHGMQGEVHSPRRLIHVKAYAVGEVEVNWNLGFGIRH